MKHNLQFDFLVDKEKNTLTIRREFLAGRQLVWDCYTKSELLDQWFAPKPLTTKTRSMDFREGGHWHYAMVEPNGTEHWGYTEYRTIKAIDFYTALDAFSNASGKINTDLPRADWRVTFTDKGDNAIVETVVTYKSLSDLETVIQMGMEQGMLATLEKLDELLEVLSKKITVTTTIDAGIEKVWNFYTNPDHITKWNFADPSWHCPSASNDMRPGGKYVARMEAKDGSFGFDFEAVYDRVVDGESFAYTMPDGRRVDVRFSKNGQQTEAVVSFDPESENPADMQKGGWQAILNSFKQYAEAN
ncbi:hypothetical protein HHL16_10960 [Pseudoflavitalea sp. G-6-1-2]|uniref:SRPBCC domain-containing protein n=1 Tax=Pseudoflavitalea sp. G-6-1-2 TaxID=2728841 RepID=UPI00146DD9FA|nr:SRPBCC domain-containing protein [Pseudoflavitalea sp. G-6-1-2]NML21397.1 hypothetical protein [Pseudoflavitalea sp. G-6-1-2]